MPDFPTADAVSPEWLTAQLKANGFDVSVASFQAQQVGTGQIGKCIRYALHYTDEPAARSANAPATIVGKFPSDDTDSRTTGVMLRNYLKEVNFYRQLQQKLTIRTPRCFFADIVDEGPDFCVLMEDLAPAQQGDQLRGCKPDVARAAVLELVGLHAPGWCDATLHDLPWLRNADVVASDALRVMYTSHLPGFLQRYGDALAADEIAIISRVGEAPSAPLFADLPELFSLVHVDYRLDNLMIEDTSAGPQITVVDWQSITLGAPLNDVSYFLGAGLLPAIRGDVDTSIVRAYHNALIAAGVSGFDWHDCWQAYRRGVFAGFGVTVVASMLVQRTPRGDQMFTAMAQRHARHALDLGAEEFLI
jgi:hypothetical protein